MRIEVFQGDDKGWYWHFVSNGRITANGESHPSKGNAMRAAKGVVRAVANELTWMSSGPEFTQEVSKIGVTTIRWT